MEARPTKATYIVLLVKTATPIRVSANSMNSSLMPKIKGIAAGTEAKVKTGNNKKMPMIVATFALLVIFILCKLNVVEGHFCQAAIIFFEGANLDKNLSP